MVPSLTTSGYLQPVASKCLIAAPLPPEPSQFYTNATLFSQLRQLCTGGEEAAEKQESALSYCNYWLNVLQITLAYLVSDTIQHLGRPYKMHHASDVTDSKQVRLTCRPEPMKPVDRFSQRFSLTPVSSQDHMAGSEGISRPHLPRPVSSCGRFSAYWLTLRSSSHCAACSAALAPALS